MKTVFLTGATGDTGRAVLPILAEHYHVLAFARNTHTTPTSKMKNVTWIRGNLSDISTYAKQLRGVHGVIHLAALVRNENAQNLFRENVENTLNLVEAAHEAACENIIVFSSAAVTQDVLTEYALSKKKMEDELHRKKIPVYIIRPTLIYGKNSHYWNRLKAWAVGKSPVAMIPNGGNAYFDPVWNEDVARALLLLLKKKPGKILTFDFASREKATLRDVVGLIARAAGKETKTIISPPHMVMTGLVHLLEKISLPVPHALRVVASAGCSYHVNGDFSRAFKMEFKSPREVVPILMRAEMK